MAERPEEAAENLELSPKGYQTTWLLSLFLGPFGVDRFYLGQWKFGLVKIAAIFYAAVAAALFGPSFLTFGPFLVLYLYDLGNAAFGLMRDRDGRTLRGIPEKKLTRILVSSGVILAMMLAIFAEREPGGSSVNEASETAEEEVPEVVFSEGIMPNYVGMNAAQVFETLDLIDERASNIYWPSGLEPRDDDWEQESQEWTVCEQEIDPGAPIDYIYKLWLGWGQGCEEFKVVPDMTGMNPSDAYKLAQSRGIVLDGASRGFNDDEYDVCYQEVEPGTIIAAGNGGRDSRVDVTVSTNCVGVMEQLAKQAAEKQRKEEEQAAREEAERIKNDPNTFEGGRRFINLNRENLQEDLAVIDNRIIWYQNGAPIGGNWNGSIFDWDGLRSTLDSIPSSPSVVSGLWEQAPDAYQERWTEMLAQIGEAEDFYDEQSRLESESILSPSEVVPSLRDLREVTRSALNLLESIPYPQQ